MNEAQWLGPDSPAGVVTTVEVAVDRAVGALDRVFSYRVDNNGPPVRVGMWVKVPLGAGEVFGLVMAVGGRPAAEAQSLRPVTMVVDPEPLLSEALVDLARWLADRYLCYLPQAIRAMVPAAVRRGVRPRELDDPWLRAVGEPARRDSKREAVWRYVHANGPVVRSAILAEFPGGAPLVRQLREAGRLEVVASPHPARPGGSPEILTDEQAAALSRLSEPGGDGRVWLLEGVTGSGKTEIYLQWIAKIQAEGGQALVLVPEIALTPQTLDRFQSRFGPGVMVWHSQLADGERAAVWHRVRSGEASVVVGARSAVFLPFSRLSAIVLDEEHETTYKQEEHPRYHTREVAMWRARREGAQVLLGSATPSLEVARQAREGQIGWIRLTRRVMERPLPEVAVVDMRRELADGNRSVFSRALAQAVSEALGRGEQAILFLNRRGFASFILCRECGQALVCPHCAVTLTYHQRQNLLTCHYCFYATSPPAQCPQCGSLRIRYFGAGTERVAEEAARVWPGVRVVRADRDTLESRDSYDRLYRGFLAGEADLLVGTQMIAKGMDFPRVTVVGVVAADIGLNLPDFRSAERTFQLLVQASGRSGRGDRPGRVVVQTYNPEHYAIVTAMRHDVDGFYRAEIEERQALGYPPFAGLWLVETTGPNRDQTAERAARAAQRLDELLAGAGELRGPAPAPIPKIRGRFRQHLLIKSGEPDRVTAALKTLAGESPHLSITVDPYYML